MSGEKDHRQTYFLLLSVNAETVRFKNNIYYIIKYSVVKASFTVNTIKL